MAATQTNIYNLTLRSLGLKRVTSTSADVEAVRVLNDLYEFVRDAVLSEHPWNFAIKYSSTLSENASAPNFGYDYSYALPSDCIRAIELDDTTYGFKQVGNNIYTDMATPKLKYIYRVTTTSEFSKSFVVALSARLAAEAAYSLTKSKSFQDQKFKEYDMKLKVSKTADAQEGTTEKQEESSWIDDRA